MREECVRTKRRSIAGRVPGKAQRWRMLQRYGDDAFVLPAGTPASMGVPAYPVMDRRGCFDCNFAKAAYNRLSQRISTEPDKSFRIKLIRGRGRLVTRTLSAANPNDPENACNWSIGAANRLRIMR